MHNVFWKQPFHLMVASLGNLAGNYTTIKVNEISSSHDDNIRQRSKLRDEVDYEG